MEEILLRPKEELKKLNLLLERRAQLESACQRVSVRYGTERVRGGSVNRDGTLSALADYDTKIEKQRAVLEAALQEAENLLDHFADASPLRIGYRDAALLRLWYLRDFSFKDVQYEMEQIGFASTGKTLRKWHSDALKRLEQFSGTAQTDD